MLMPVARHQRGSLRERLVQILDALDAHDAAREPPRLDDRKSERNGEAIKEPPAERHPAAGARRRPIDRIAEPPAVFHALRAGLTGFAKAGSPYAWRRADAPSKRIRFFKGAKFPSKRPSGANGHRLQRHLARVNLPYDTRCRASAWRPRLKLPGPDRTGATELRCRFGLQQFCMTATEPTEHQQPQAQ